MDYETAYQNLVNLLKWAQENNIYNTRNEAATRLHLVNNLLIDCLGWPIEQVDPERYFSGDYSDYELGLPARKLLVEAKKEGIYFELPLGFNKNVCQIKTLFSLNNEVKNAIHQAMNYCQKRGIPIGVVTNGHQLIAFISNRLDGVSPDDGCALVFESIEIMISKFKDLWDALSPAGVDVSRLNSLLSDKSILPPPDKLSLKIISYPGFKNRNPVAAELQILGGLFLEDIARLPEFEEEFIRDTYCESGAISQYAVVSRQILSSRYSSYFQKESRATVKPARSKKGIQPELREDLLAAGISKRPIILVGDVGVGKSMFIKHLILVDAKDVLSNAIVLYLDFGKKPALAQNLSKHVIEEIERQLREDYKIDIYEKNFVHGVYNLELIRFTKGIYGDLKESNPEAYKEKEIEHLTKLISNSEEHIKACVMHIVNGRKKLVVLFLDNVDQRSLSFQEQVFLIAQSTSQTWPITAFVALRPDTFSRSRASGSLSAYQPRVFTIDPPRVDKVLQKRLEYALAKLKSAGTLPSFPSGVRLDSKRLEKYMEMLSTAFSESTEIISYIDNMSNGNLRKALDFVVDFVGSAHVDSDKIFHKIEEQGFYTLPLHEFLRAVLFRDNEYYNPYESTILNVYDVFSNDIREHFLLLIILSYIDKMGTKAGSEGFVPIQDIYDYIQGMGFLERQIHAFIERAIAKNLISPPGTIENSEIDRLRIMTSGAYILKELAHMFTYIDAIIIDTPIFNESFRLKIHNVEQIEERFQRAHIFAEYLDSCWNDSLSGVYDWRENSILLKDEINLIQYKMRVKTHKFHK